jgi:hypothetical protein
MRRTMSLAQLCTFDTNNYVASPANVFKRTTETINMKEKKKQVKQHHKS